jgi:peptidoglycan-associated lipoprotein
LEIGASAHNLSIPVVTGKARKPRIVVKQTMDKTRMSICRAIGLGCLAFWLAGCSVVVFEDSSVCPAPAAASCPAAPPPPPGPEVVDTSPAQAEPVPAASSAPVASSASVAPVAAPAPANPAAGHRSHFAYDSAVLDKAALAGLVFVADSLKTDKSSTILVEGHCDERGTRDYNLALGEKRAAAVKAALVRLGVAKARIRIISYGKERPADRGNTEAAWAKNRRTVIRFNPS